MNLFHRAHLLPIAAAACSLSLLALPASLSAQRAERAVTPSGVAISPDGAFVTYIVGRRGGGALHLVSVIDPARTSEQDKLLTPPGPAGCTTEDPIWSPDSQTLAILSTCATDAKKGQEEVLLWSRATGQFKQLTHLIGELHEMAYSPDGKSIAFLFVENATRSAGALDAMPPWDGVIGEDHVEIQRIYKVDAATGNGDWVTPEKLHVYEFGWSPDSAKIAYTAANPPGENTWWIAKLYSEPVASGSAPTVVFDPNTTTTAMHGLQLAVPRYSPDGSKIAFIGGLMSDQGSTGGDVWVVDSKGGEPTDVTPNIDGTPCFEAWLNNGTIGIVEDRRGSTLLPDVNIAKREIVPNSTLDLGQTTISGGAIKDSVTVSFTARLIAYAKSGINAAPEVWVGRTGYEKQLTHLNVGLKPAARTESVEWENEGFHVQGWLTFPANYNPAKKYPLIVTVHGGPSSSVGSRFGGGNWAEHGYFEFQPNPRGSFGQGEKFVQANRKDFGYGDLRDILKGLDMLEAKYPIDKHREGLTGWSYGGFMSMFAETQTDRFATIIAGAGISNWQSYYGENSIDQWMVPFFGASVYDDPAVYAKSSAITYIHKSKTPMLIIVGDRDGECPAPQSFEMWHALKAMGVKTQLVIYPDEGHGFRNPAHIADRMAREVKWFAEYMPAK
ncbi:prolyl oligopeptidase family serine peptidase [Granulicella sp. 5B5]|uniref:S9 family peptidase n=1 Tax=Granulicella sp. 5B5 TaxID=1617967 RepID=UPI0015F54CB7|nr:S9 family peptidase [Granulicella sp. 5B5]QMV19132.1 prolyl oligopeptidase family serine peptidase [Granulicella sp. 5B5]